MRLWEKRPGGWYPVKVGDKSGWVSGDYVIAETSYSYGETKEEEEKRIAEEEAQEKMAASVVCGADGRPGTRPVGAVSQGRVNTPSQAPGTPGRLLLIMLVSLSEIHMFGEVQA